MINLHTICQVLSYIVCFSIGFSVAFVLIRLGACIYHDTKAAKEFKAQQEETVKALSKPKAPTKPSKPRPSKRAKQA